MEFLEKLGDFFNGLLGGFERLLTGAFGSSNERRIRQIGFVRDRKAGTTVITPGSILDRINQLEPELEKLTDDELRQTTPRMREQLAKGRTLDDLLPEAFASVREAGKRYLKMRHYDVQMVGGYILHHGMIAEMATGEGKTLVATLPAFLNGLAGNVHVITVNDYLAKRDMEWMGPLHMGLGLSVGAIQSNMGTEDRAFAYSRDITYGTNNEFGFDYLRDNMKPTADLQVQRKLNYAIIDEIDNILIDEARTPLIISGPAHDDVTKYPKAHRIALQLKRDEHFEVKEKEHTCHLTDVGVRYAEELAGVESFYTAGNMEWPHLIDNALKALHLYKRDVQYIVERGDVVIIDEHTGRKMEGRQWSDGLHQAVEAKEGVRIKEETQTYATITLQNFFKLYKKLSGMTGTAMTEANEFWKIYKLDVVTVPPNRPTKRILFTDSIYRTEKEKWDAIVKEVKEVSATGRPVLVGTISIENSELLSNKLIKQGIRHNILNAKYHEREAEIIAQAGRMNAVTISTNMAGRGTDIILGGNPEHMAWEELHKTYASRLEVPKQEWDQLTKQISEKEGMASEGRKVAELGGLHVVGTERHDSRRIDLQLRGRAGRQGDPGSSRFFLSLEDDLMRKFAGDWVREWLGRMGMEEGEPIISGMVTGRIEAAQKKVEERHFETRKHLLEYDEVMDEQRKRVYSYRQGILEGANCRQLILEMIDRQLTRWTKHFLANNYRWETCAQWANDQLGVEVDWSDLRDMDLDRMTEFLKSEAIRQAEDQIREQTDENLPEDAENESDRNWNAMARWVNAHFGLNTNDRELKKIGVAELPNYLYGRAKEAIDRYDFKPLESFLDPEWGLKSLAGWADNQYGIKVDIEKLRGATPEAAHEFINDAIEEAYEDKEVDFPVSVGMSRFLDESNSGGHRYDRAGLLAWANGRFQTRLDPAEVEQKPRHEIARLLHEQSQEFLDRGPEPASIRKRLDGFVPAHHLNGSSNGHAGLAPEVAQQLTTWVKEEFQAEWNPEEVQSLSRPQIEQKLLFERERRYRPELYQAEKSLIIECLDTAWKDHLYYMDHLRSGIGLVGYAQKDPKVEYRREGMRAFDQMWNRIADQVTGAIFRIEQLSPDFVGSLWTVTSATHAAPPPVDGESSSSSAAGQSSQAVETIRNKTTKVGRNDPCPCGSGKKYKKCCGQE